MTTLTFTLTADQIAQVIAENGGGNVVVTPTGPTPPNPPPVVFKNGTILKDGSTAVLGMALTDLAGATHSVTINNNQTAVFPFVVPSIQPNGQPVSQILLTHFQTLDNLNSTPRVAWISQTPGYIVPAPIAGYAKGVQYPSIQWMYGVGGVATLTCVLDSGNYCSNGNVHMKAGDTWYVMFQNRDSKGKPSCTGNCLGNVSLKAQP